jgi:hypothetical protein
VYLEDATNNDDETGSKLPIRQGAWAYLRPIEINSTDEPRIGASSQDIVSGVKQNGYFILPVSYEEKTAEHLPSATAMTPAVS